MNFTLTFSVEELNLINAVLIKRPFEEVVGLINSINSQLKAASEKENSDVHP